jgi:hypothetical protein
VDRDEAAGAVGRAGKEQFDNNLNDICIYVTMFSPSLSGENIDRRTNSPNDASI